MNEKTLPTDEALLLPASTVRFTLEDGENVVMAVGDRKWEVGVIAMAFPLSNRNQIVVVRDEQGEEIGIIDDVSALDPASRRIVRQEVEKSYFLPRIVDVREVTEKLDLVTWKVVTDRGLRTFQVRHIRQNVRQIGRRRVIIRDVDGNRYEIQNWTALSPRSQRQIEEYL